MPLHPLQDLIVRTASALPETHTIALAGGGAMTAHGFVDRATQDVDLFTELDDAQRSRPTHHRGCATATRPAAPPAAKSTRECLIFGSDSEEVVGPACPVWVTGASL